jgi:hypothetical protein
MKIVFVLAAIAHWLPRYTAKPSALAAEDRARFAESAARKPMGGTQGGACDGIDGGRGF